MVKKAKRKGITVKERKVLLFIGGLVVGSIFMGIIGGIIDLYVSDTIMLFGTIPFSTDRAIWVIAPAILTFVLVIVGIKSKYDMD